MKSLRIRMAGRIIGLGIWAGLFFVQGLFAQGGGADKKRYKVTVTPAEMTVETGEEIQYLATLEDASGALIDTTFTWSLLGAPVGTIDETGLFIASRPGSAQVVATVGRLSGRALVTVEGDSICCGPDGFRVMLVPKDTVLVIGDSTMIQAMLMDSLGNVSEVEFDFRVENAEVAHFEGGMLHADARGHTFFYATDGVHEGKGHLTVLRDTTLVQHVYRFFKIEVSPRDTLVPPEATVQYSAVMTDTNGVVIDTTFQWSVEGEGFGEISSEGLFTALERGQGFVYATAGEISGKAHVTVIDTSAHDSLVYERGLLKLRIDPEDAFVAIGHQMHFAAYLEDSLGNRIDTTAVFRLAGRRVGSITEDGLFTAETRGIGLVKARLDQWSAVTKVFVASEEDTLGSDSIHVRIKDRSGAQAGNLHRLGEKDVLKISGLGFPLNVLNGAEVAFPPGALDGDIDIDVTLSNTAEVGSDSVSYFEEILNGISFHVYIGDSLASPYYFDEPVEVVIPYKDEVLELLGLSAEDLWIFFYSDSTGLDSLGVSNVVIDTAANKIYAEIQHFSDLVIAPRACACTTGIQDMDSIVPVSHALYANYPNPFNPETQIRFFLSGEKSGFIRLTIYNLLGQQVRVLVSESLAPGSHTVAWDGRDEAGRLQGSGMYIYRLETGQFNQSRRMILMK